MLSGLSNRDYDFGSPKTIRATLGTMDTMDSQKKKNSIIYIWCYTKALKERMSLIANADLTFQAVLKTYKWKESYDVKDLGQSNIVRNNAKKALVPNHRDIIGGSIINVPAKNHFPERDFDELTKFIAYCWTRWIRFVNIF